MSTKIGNEMGSPYQILQENDIMDDQRNSNSTEQFEVVEKSLFVLTSRVQCEETCILFSGCIVLDTCLSLIDTDNIRSSMHADVEKSPEVFTGKVKYKDNTDDDISKSNSEINDTEIIEEVCSYHNEDEVSMVGNECNYNKPEMSREGKNVTEQEISHKVCTSEECSRWKGAVCLGGSAFGLLILWGVEGASSAGDIKPWSVTKAHKVCCLLWSHSHIKDLIGTLE